MLTFKKVLSVFDPFLAENGIYEIVQTSHGHTILEWDSRSQEWISVKLCATPEGLAETLLDDLTGNLDADTAEEITAILKESAHAFGKCVVVVTHSGEVAKQADVVLEIKRGHLKEREM